MEPRETIIKLLAGLVKELVKTKNITFSPEELEIPPSPELGDYAYPCFLIAKEMKISPVQAAQKLAEKIKLESPIEKVDVKGPYLNFFINTEEIASYVIEKIREEKDDYGKIIPKKSEESKRIMIEYPSPNTNKPLHLGHIRNILIGSSMSHIFRYTGNDVIQANLNNDRGIHICKSMLAYKKWGGEKRPDIKTDHFVGKFYVLFNEKLKENPLLEKEAQEMLVKWEQKDDETIQLWKLMNSWAYGGFEETYEKLGVVFDKYYYESEFYDKGKEIILEGLKYDIFKKDSEGVIYADLEKTGLGKKVLLRPDGTSIYITQDIYLAKFKFDDYELDKSIYVVGSEQNHHFKVLFSILKMLGYKWADKCHHLSYGMVYLPSGKMKSREGTVIDADDLIENMKDLAGIEIRKRYSDIYEEEVEERARKIGLAALKFFLIKIDPSKDIYFDPKESISFEGETGPYVQYAHARICSVLKKSEKEGIKISKIKKIDYKILDDSHETRLIKLLYKFPDTVKEAGNKYKPNLIANYLTELSQAFNDFYHNCPILIAAASERRDARLVLADCTRHVIARGLNLLGIEAPEEM